MELSNIPHNSPGNIGGVKEAIYVCKKSDIASGLVLPATPTTFTEAITMSTAPVMVIGKVFKKIYCTRETGELKEKLVGDVDGKSFESEIDFSHPGTNPEMIGFISENANEDLVIIVPEANGTLRLLGHEYAAKIMSSEINSGKKTADFNHVKITISSMAKTPAPIVTFAIPLV